MKIEWKKFQLIWCWGLYMYLINVFHFISACQGTGDCSSLKRWRNSAPWWRLGVFWLRAGLSLCWGIIKLSCFSKFLLAPNSHHKTHSLQWDSIVAIPPAGGQLLYPHCAGKRDTSRNRVEMLSPEALQAGRAAAGIPKAWPSHSLLSFFKTCSPSSIAQLKTKRNKE